MILDPDFLDHWKTRLFIDLMEDEMASNYILRLWFHCQLRRTTTFPGMTGQVLRSVCRYKGDGDKLLQTMAQVGFIEVDENTVSVPKWAEANEKMMANWDNGKKGGRPPNTPENKGSKTHPKPTDNPPVTHSKPEERIGEDKRGEDREEKEEIAQSDELEKIAADMATEFHFTIPGSSRPLLPDLRENFLAKLTWLKANGRDETELIWRKIRDPTRDKTKVFTVNQMFKFWQYCGLEESDERSGNGKKAIGQTVKRAVPGGDAWGDAKRYDGSRVKTVRYGDGNHGVPGPEEPVIQPSQPAGKVH